MATAVQPDPQTSIYETVIDDAEIEEALEARDKAKRSARAVQKKAKEADETAKALLDRLELGLGAVVRVGRFLVSLREVDAKEVSFETAKTTRITIKALDGAES